MVEDRLRAGVIRLGNPMDLGDLFDLEVFHQIVVDTLARSDIDGMLVVYNYNGVFFPEDSRGLVDAIKATCQEARKPVALCVATTDEEWRLNRSHHPNFPMFDDPVEAAHALAVSRDFQAQRPAGFTTAEHFRIEKDEALAIVAAAKARQARQLTTAEAFQVLSCYGIPLVPWAHAQTVQEASDQAVVLGYPVAMKVMGEQFVHKSELGGVLLDLENDREVRVAYERLAALILETEPGDGKQSVLIQKMVSGGHEIFVGGRQDPTFGPVVLTGLGGIYVEVFGDVSLRVAPIDAAEARKMIGEIRGAQLLEGVRGQPAADCEALTEVAQRISRLVCDLPELQELDVNPLRVFSQGEGCLALDCRMVLAGSQRDQIRRNDHYSPDIS
jgi:acetyltransferase